MPAKGPVSLTWQTIFCFIPIMDIVASYRVKRLRWYLLIFIVFGAISTGVQTIVNPLDETSVYNEKVFSEETGFDWNYAIFGNNPELTILTIIIHNGIAYAIAVYLIRRWSKKWNLQFT
ncbi:MAG: hypothetical protein LVO36_01970 [Nitrosopumilus sp. (ex Thoosa mismalolli)]|nr:hypothetical protein [Nitrosopumilus sp. (ex Thoosa mismalolli)]